MFSAACVQGVSRYVAMVSSVAVVSYVAVESSVSLLSYVLVLL